MKTSGFLAVSVTLWLGVAGMATAESDRPVKLTFGVVPQKSTTQLAEDWTPVLGYLSQKTGYRLEFKTAQDTATFEERVEAGAYDFAYFNPLHYATFRTNGYLAVARERDTRLVGIVVVPRSSRYTGLKDLNGITMAFPSPSAFAATVLTQMSIQQRGMHVVPKYVGSHESVYRSVAQGLYPAGGGIVKTYDSVAPEVRAKLRILWRSEAYTSHPVAVHRRVPADVQQRVVSALIAMDQNRHGRALLKNAGYRGFVAAQDGDYEDIRRLKVNIDHSGIITPGR